VSGCGKERLERTFHSRGLGSTAKSDGFGAVWESTPHTRAKHAILRQYWNRWLPILGQRNRGLNYVDGFAGPGEYTDGEEGSPLIVLRAAVEHVLRPSGQVSFTFVEKDADRAGHLKAILTRLFPREKLPKGWEYSVELGEFDPILNSAIDSFEASGTTLAPTFAFLDPFGYSGFPMSTIRRLMAIPRCEVLVTFMAGYIRRFLDDLRAETLTSLFGTDEWRGGVKLEGDARVRFLLDLYEKRLKEEAQAAFVRSFEMCGPNGETLYYLVFATRHEEGLRQMKEAMYAVDRRESYRFSDLTDPGQKYLLDYLEGESPEWVDTAAAMVYERFRGQLVPAPVAKDFVWLTTPYVWRAPVFKTLEKDGRIVSVTGRGKGGGFGDSCVIRFKP
jgi:three-Cys-motif partner protein